MLDRLELIGVKTHRLSPPFLSCDDVLPCDRDTKLLAQLKKLIKPEAPEALLNPLSLMGYPRPVKASAKLLLTNKSCRLRLDLQVVLMRCSTLIGKEPTLVKGQRLPQEIPHLLSQLSAHLTYLELYMIPDTRGLTRAFSPH